MFLRLDEFAKTLPRPKPGELSAEAFRELHVMNAHRLRAEAMRQTLAYAGQGLGALAHLALAPFRRAKADGAAHRNGPAGALSR